MRIFAADASARAASAAIMSDGVLVAESFADVGLTHSETLMALIDDVFRRASLTPAEIDYFAVTSGPGSFTGLRIAASSIKGMAFAVYKRCVAVPTLEASAEAFSDFSGAVVPVIDARNGRYYNAGFRFKNGLPERLWEDRVSDLGEIACSASEAGLETLFTADGAVACYEALKDELPCRCAAAALRMTRASFTAAAAQRLIEQGRTVCANELAPNYMQLPQAERERRKRLALKENEG